MVTITVVLYDYNLKANVTRRFVGKSRPVAEARYEAYLQRHWHQEVVSLSYS